MELSKHHKSISLYLKSDDDSVVLTEGQQNMLDKYEKAYGLLIKHKSAKVAATVMSKMSDWNSIYTAQRDLRICEQLFGSINESSKVVKRQIAESMAQECFETAQRMKNVDQMNKATANYIKASGINMADIDMPKFEDLIIPESPIVIGLDFLEQYADRLDAKILDKIRQALASSKIFKYLPELAETIPFENIKEE